MMIGLLIVALFMQLPAALQGRTGTVTGVVRTSKGTPVEGVRVAVAPVGDALADAMLESLALTDAAGRFTLENVSPGRYNIVIGRSLDAQYHPGVLDAARATTIVVGAGAVVDVPAMVLGRSSVTGRILDMATGVGRRIEKLELCCPERQVAPITGGFITVSTASRIAASIAPDGSFTFAEVPPGHYTLQTFDPAIVPTLHILTVENRDVEGVKVAVTAGTSVSGLVTDRTGKPVSAALRLRPSLANEIFEVPGGQAPSSIVASSASSTPSQILATAVANGISQFTTVFIPAGSLPGASRENVEGIRTRLQRAARIPTVIAGTDGRFSFTKVLPGTYTLEYTSIGHSFEREIQVGIEAMQDVAVPLPVTLVKGRIAAEGGASLPKIAGSIRFVELREGGRILYGFPESDGLLSMLLPPGEYRLFTENLGPRVKSIADGVRDITDALFTFDGSAGHELLFVVEP